MAMPRSRGVTSAPRSAGPGFTPYERLRDMSLRRSAREGTKGADGLPVMNSASLRAAAIEHDGYETPELNDRLYLHFKGLDNARLFNTMNRGPKLTRGERFN